MSILNENEFILILGLGSLQNLTSYMAMIVSEM